MRQEIQDAVMKVYDETDEVVPNKRYVEDSRRSLIDYQRCNTFAIS